jgi:hypothetical protein
VFSGASTAGTYTMDDHPVAAGAQAALESFDVIYIDDADTLIRAGPRSFGSARPS